MSLSMPFREFARLKLVASMTSEGNTSMQFEPSSASLIPDDVGSNVVFHFQSSVSNGVNTLTIYVTGSAPLTGSTSTTPEHGSIGSSLDHSSETNFGLSPRGSNLDIPDPSFCWIGDSSTLDPLFSQSQASSFQQGSLAQHAMNSTMSHMETSYPGYSELLQDYRDNTSTSLTNDYPSWTDPAIFSLPFMDPSTSSIPSSASSSLPTTPSVCSTASPASNFSEITMDDQASASSPEASCQCPLNHPPALPRRVVSSASSSLAHRHRDTTHSRSRSQPDAYHIHHSRSRGVPVKSSFPCTFVPCPEVFSRKHDRMRHEVAQHGLQCEWVCDRCRKFFSSEKTLAKHKCNVNVDVRWTAPAQNNTGQDGGVSQA
ncbi:hypothetical protein F5878DRAFT_123783 [Lentinula raphanica]|uniref:C2H2-type domain-containing protein n=1 Tax=Lentinula raphanica TaxID=153919 RepID=A0AA38PAX7_9AGAR|nr:hypothetical protein F5880DRAFT_1612414 [Lentinula raphanica]KAJ3839366.1 hypothetical protein F5878DRAFT_123783 [Lentinula raphanica]